MKYFDKHGHLNTEGIALYVDALKLDKSSNLPEDVFEHVEDCTSCHSQAIELYTNVGVIDYAGIGAHPTLDKPSTEPKPVIRHWLFLTLILLGLVSLVWILVQNINDNPGEKRGLDKGNNIENLEILPTPPVDSGNVVPAIEGEIKGKELFNNEDETKDPPENKIRENDEAELIAMDFKPFGDLENQVGEVFRSDDVEISGPANGARFKIGQTINLDWSDDKDTHLSVLVLDNKNNEIIRRENAKSPYTIGNLKPGIYYWKLETENDLLHVGKFFVDRIE